MFSVGAMQFTGACGRTENGCQAICQVICDYDSSSPPRWSCGRILGISSEFGSSVALSRCKAGTDDLVRSIISVRR